MKRRDRRSPDRRPRRRGADWTGSTAVLFLLLGLPLVIAVALDHWAIGYEAHDVTTVIGTLPPTVACERLAVVAAGEGLDPRDPERKLRREASRLGGNVVQMDSDANTIGMAYRCGAPALARLHPDHGSTSRDGASGSR